MALRGAVMGAQPPAVSVRVESATRGALVELVSVPGEIQPEEKVKLSARVPAQILDLPHKEGDTVTAFDQKATGPATQPAESSVLVRLDAKDLESSLKSAESHASAQEA